MTHLNPPGVRFLASIGFALLSLLAACSDNSTNLRAVHAECDTAGARPRQAGQCGSSGSRVLVHVILFGPEQDLDLFAFRFGIEIGNSNLVSLVPQSSYVQTTLTADAGQTIAIDVNASDPSVVKVNVEKVGGGAGKRHLRCGDRNRRARVRRSRNRNGHPHAGRAPEPIRRR